MTTSSYQLRRSQLLTYFDRTAVDAWARLTSDAPVSGIRATVRAGRDEMRNTLLDWLPQDLAGYRLLDAGCGTGALSVEAARRGADVLAIDLSPTLVDLARQRMPLIDGPGRITFTSGDMLDPALGRFDFVVAMDSLIHYAAQDIVRVLSGFAERTTGGVVFTFAPKTAALAAMHSVGKLFPKSDRAPAIEPVAEHLLRSLIIDTQDLAEWMPARTKRVARGFYTSQAMELRRP